LAEKHSHSHLKTLTFNKLMRINS